MNSVMTEDPLIIIGYVAALALTVFAFVKKSGVAPTIAAVILFCATTAYAVVYGATLYETATVAVIFFIAAFLMRSRGRNE